jgi:transcriptional regulator with XRE-family HTH domain
MQLKNLDRFLESPDQFLSRKIEINMALLDRIHFLLRKKFGGRQKDLARAMGISEAAISKMINGVSIKNIETDTLIRLEQIFGEPILGVHTNHEDKNADYTAIGTSCTIRGTTQVDNSGALSEIDFTTAGINSIPSKSPNKEKQIFL